LLLTSTLVDFLGAVAIEGKKKSIWQVMLMSTIPLAWLLFCSWTGMMQISLLSLAAASGLMILLTFAHSFFWLFQEQTRRKAFVIFSIMTNLTILGFFKYFNFFADSTRNLLGSLGIQAGWVLPEIILPVGISFFTFQTLAYVIDVYRKQQSACEDFPIYAIYLSFFPQILAGPIGRAPQLIPQ